jgi:hypothetical protein
MEWRSSNRLARREDRKKTPRSHTKRETVVGERLITDLSQVTAVC